ncbi:MAG: HigA family addiction module antitoxin [Pseudomonadota bacterium]
MADKTKQPALRGKVHPGAILREDVLPELGMTQAVFADAIGVSRQTVSAVLNERRSISVDFAKRLSAALGGSAESWLTMQLYYDLAHSPDVKVKRIAA